MVIKFNNAEHTFEFPSNTWGGVRGDFTGGFGFGPNMDTANEVVDSEIPRVSLTLVFSEPDVSPGEYSIHDPPIREVILSLELEEPLFGGQVASYGVYSSSVAGSSGSVQVDTFELEDEMTLEFDVLRAVVRDVVLFREFTTDESLYPELAQICVAEFRKNAPGFEDAQGACAEAQCDTAIDCDDGMFCNGIEHCTNGFCGPGADPCGDTQGCDEELDECFFICTEEADCDDGDACTDDSCIDGVCEYNIVDCDDGMACTDDFCDSAVGCVNTDNCTGGLICNSNTGTCVCDDDADCPQGQICNPANGNCED